MLFFLHSNPNWIPASTGSYLVYCHSELDSESSKKNTEALIKPIISEVTPVRIHIFNKVQLPFSLPIFDLFFPVNCS